MSDAIGLNRGTPHELLAAGGQLALKGDIWDDLSVQNIVQKILDLFGLDIPNWQEIIASFDGLRDAFEGTYVGNDPALNVIQNIVKTLRNGLTGIIDWARIPQLSLSQLTNQPGPNLLSGFGDFADGSTLDGGSDWTWDGSVGGGSARAVGSGTRKVLTSELVAVSEGQQMTAAGKVQWAGAAGTGAAMQLIVMPFVGDAAQAEVVISNITSPPASSSGNFVALSGSYVPAAGVTGVRVRITVEAALTAGAVWWDDVTLRKVATSLPQQFISGLEGALSQLGADVNAALGWIKDLIQRITGRARTTLEDALTDAATFATQLRTLLLGGSVSSPLPNLTSLVQLGQSQITNLVSDLGGKASTAAVNTINTFIQNLVDAILQAIRKVPVVGGSIADIIADVGGLRDTAVGTKEAITAGYAGASGGDAAVNAVIADYQDRITALENGGTMFLLTSSQTLDLSAYSTFKVYLFGAGRNGSVASGYDAGPGGAGGNFRFRVFSKAQLVGYGVDMSAVQAVVGAGNSAAGNPTRFGNFGASWALDTGTASGDSYAIDSDGLFRDVTAKTPPGNGGSGGAGARKADQGSFAGASPGGTTHLATGGAAGQAYGEAGQPGANADLASGREFAGGAGGGGGNGGAMGNVFNNSYLSAGGNGGNGGNGGFPGAGGGGTGGGGRGTSTGTPGQIPGAGAPGVAIVVAS